MHEFHGDVLYHQSCQPKNLSVVGVMTVQNSEEVYLVVLRSNEDLLFLLNLFLLVGFL